MSKEDRTMLPAAVVPGYQNSFVRVVSELDERSIAYCVRQALDLYILDLYRNDPTLFEKVTRRLTEDERRDIESVIRGE